MQHKETTFGGALSTRESHAAAFASVYYYLFAGIALVVAVFLFV